MIKSDERRETKEAGRRKKEEEKKWGNLQLFAGISGQVGNGGGTRNRFTAARTEWIWTTINSEGMK